MSDAYRQLMASSDNSARTNFQTSNTRPPEDYTDYVPGSHSDQNIVQDIPKTVKVDRYVIVDASQRDWVKQPNPFSNLNFAFGVQETVASNPPVYYNNSFIPTFAVEQSNLVSPIPGMPNLTGWTQSATPSNIQYPAYNSSLPKGNFIGYDLGYLIQPSGSGFGSVFTPCNVSSIRLVRAVLPQRQFLDFTIIPGDASNAEMRSLIADKPYSTFSTYPYLLFGLNQYFGQYIGGNEPMRRSFSVMTQKQRTQTDFQISVGVQQYDYEPWGAEALQFQSPITNLQKLQIDITDPTGTPFIQNDNISLSLIQADASTGLFLRCFTSSFNYFSGNDVRVGDRIKFYNPTLTSMIKSEILGVMNIEKKSFVEAMSNKTFPVLELLDYVTDSNGIYRPRTDISGATRTAPYISSYNGFVIPNFTKSDPQGNVTPLYPNSIDSETGNVLDPNQLINSNLPVLNTTLQPVYTLELSILQPDTGSIGGGIVV
jgi:hypothetical protein